MKIYFTAVTRQEIKDKNLTSECMKDWRAQTQLYARAAKTFQLVIHS